MPLQPIDMQMPVQRSADVILASNNAAHRPEVMRQQFAEQLQRETEHNDKHVRQSNKTEESLMRQERRGASKRGPQGDKKDNEKKKAALELFKSGNIIDIRV